MYRQYNQHGYGNDPTYQPQDLAGSFVYQQFSPSMRGQMGHEMQQQQHLSPPMRSVPTSSPSHSRHGSNDSNGARRGASRSLSPRVGSETPSRNISFVPSDRSLPLRDVTAETITDAYVSFILYCNPNFDLDVDTNVLRSNFSSPPKSDNKDFETFRLFQLIRKFDAKEIKTWGQLALDLGVEAPDTTKGQSVQKVQQYSVRLKRWMRAMHVDAFFEYLLGKPHSYYQDIPHPTEPYPVGGRDGVAAEEDLAIRALDPSFRPKRGRRRNSEAEQDDDGQQPTNTAQQAAPQSAYPASAYHSADITFTTSSSTDPWVNPSIAAQDFGRWVGKLDGPHSAIATTAPSHIRWQNPGTPHPVTALPGSMIAHIDAALHEEPKSAITPSSRKRRKHGPAVSSAWPSANAPGAKPRGRPPANRNLQDGPYNTFPADPTNDKSKATGNATKSVEQADESQSWSAAPQPPQIQSEAGGRPGRLSLQVPRHTGGPVRLATPPRVMITNETSESEHSIMDNVSMIADTRNQEAQVDVMADTAMTGFSYETLKRVLASDLLRAELLGRHNRLNGEEAKRLAETILQRLNVAKDDQSDITRLTAASWLGVGGHLNIPFGPATGQGKRIVVTRFRVGPDGYEELVSAGDMESTASREMFDLSWSSSMGSCNGTFELKGLSLADAPPKPFDIHDAILETWTETARRVGLKDERIRNTRDKYAESFSTRTVLNNADDRSVDYWKARCQSLEFGGKIAKGEFHRYRERLIQRVLDTII